MGSFLEGVRKGIADVPPDESLTGLETGPPPAFLPRVVQHFEEVTSVAFFAVMLATVLVGVFFRFVLSSPLVWTVGVSSSAFLWTASISAGLGHRNDGHIQFDLVYEKLPIRLQRWARALGHLLIASTFVAAILGTIDFLAFMQGNKVTGTSIGFGWAFAGLLYFFVMTPVHRLVLLIEDIRSTSKPR